MKAVFDLLSLRSLRDSQVEMSHRWLDFGIWRSGIRSWVKFWESYRW